MKALSIKQPWAWAILEGFKPVENRKWFTKFRGDLLIHSPKSYDKIGEIVLLDNGIQVPRPDLFDYGALIGKVTVIDCVRHHPSPFFFGPWGFVLENPVKFEKAIVWRGQLGLFDVPDEMLKGMI